MMIGLQRDLGIIFIITFCIAINPSSGKTCSGKINVTPVKHPSIFSELTSSEIGEVLRYIKKELNTTKSTNGGLSDTFAYVIEKKTTSKEDVLEHIDRNGPVPLREARVVLYSPLEIAEYTVGPLPNLTYHFRAENPRWNRRDLKFSERTFYTPSDASAIAALVHKEGRKLKRLLQESFDEFHMNDDCRKRCISYNFLRPTVLEHSRVMWVYLKRKVDISLGSDRLYPLPLQMLLNMTSSNSTSWKVFQVWYNDQFFDSSDDLMRKYNNGTVARVTIPLSNTDIFSSMKQRAKKNSKSSKRRGPDCFPQDGRRFAIEGNRVTYINWEFEFSNRQSTGPQLFDIRFRKERIVYELSLQEALLSYTGNTPMSRHANVYLDGEVLLGNFISPMAPGVDCPKGSTYFNSTIYNYIFGTSVVIPNAFCIFEDIDGPPLKRHYEYTSDGSYAFYAGMPNNALVLRTMQTIDNYDFIYDFIFYQNGVLGTKVSASAYVVTEFTKDSTAERGKYGFQIHENVFAMFHQHLFNFKVDVDIKGRSNRHETLAVKIRPTTHKDDEDTSSTIYNSFNQLDPVLNFDSYISDNENITDEDLVAWVTVGLQHLPTSATDVPVTTTAGNTLSFYLKPFHYFDEDPSMSSHDNVFITPGQNDEENVDENENNALENCCPPKDKIRFENPIHD
ncbi:unnamed protein product [Owenia fusiformis]|uniref:Amine oxidase n=1 Tax=Owenia fusiformis TaxID=6347 RepID=A0A8S4PJ16_OWEFU|nr:unnamed protein product [Owenia fusiformis]